MTLARAHASGVGPRSEAGGRAGPHSNGAAVNATGGLNGSVASSSVVSVWLEVSVAREGVTGSHGCDELRVCWLPVSHGSSRHSDAGFRLQSKPRPAHILDNGYSVIKSHAKKCC